MPGILDRFSLAGRAVLVTGATGHLGRSIALAIAEAGGHVLVNGRSHERCRQLVRSFEDLGHSAEPAVFDVAQETAAQDFFANRAGALHCVINNAYAGGAGTIETADPAAYREGYESAVVAAHLVVRAALPSLRRAVEASGEASIINIASMYGLVSPDISIYPKAEGSNPPFYGAAKAGLLQWTRYAACEFGREGIRANSIAPGPFPSASVREAAPDFVDTLGSRVPLGRVGEASEIQGAVLLLASPASSYINGANLSVDGGWTSW